MESKFFNQPCRDNALTKINITNLVDVALTMVVILLMVSPFIEQGIQVKLPVSGPVKLSVQKPVILTVAQDKRIFVGDTPVSLSELKTVLKEKAGGNPDFGVIVKGDSNISYQDLINVLDAIKSASITRIGLATRIGQTK